MFLKHICEYFLYKFGLITDVEGRRRKDKDMSGLLIFSFIAMGMIMVPLGFQFLAVLGGKALLLAKMALLLASIQGLKKLATSNLNYGFYQTTFEQEHPFDHDHGHGHGHCKRRAGLLTNECFETDSGPDSESEDFITFEFKFEDLSGLRLIHLHDLVCLRCCK